MPNAQDAVAYWVARLWGISPERQAAAHQCIDDWGIPHLREALAPGIADRAVASVFLVESFDALVERGIDAKKLLGKLRGDLDIWPTWAELRSAGLLARHTDLDARFLVEPDRSKGRHADFAFEYADGTRHSIEFKAIGLSDAEANFGERMGPLLPGLLPRVGVSTMHLLDSTTDVVMNRAERRAHRLRAERLAKNLHPVARGIAAATIVGHGTAPTYATRLARRFHEAIEQLPTDNSCWVAFHWSNGSPVTMVRRALAAAEIPEHVTGVVLTGTIAIPGSIDNFIVIFPRPFDSTDGEEIWNSDTTVEDAQAIFTSVDRSSGLRPTYIRVPYAGRTYDFIRRTGDQRIFPFNLVLDPDPPDLIPDRDPEAAVPPALPSSR